MCYYCFAIFFHAHAYPSPWATKAQWIRKMIGPGCRFWFDRFGSGPGVRTLGDYHRSGPTLWNDQWMRINWERILLFLHTH